MAKSQIPEATDSSMWSKIKAWVVGITGVLVVVPALINGGVDIYKSFLNLPRTDAERANVQLFKKYFGKSPKFTQPLIVKVGGGTYDVNFSVYEEGDIYVQYGNFTQWFPFPRNSDTDIASLRGHAVALAVGSNEENAPFKLLEGPKPHTSKNLLFFKDEFAEFRTGKFVNVRTGKIELPDEIKNPREADFQNVVEKPNP